LKNVVIQEVRVQVPVPMASKEIFVPIIDEQPDNIEQQINEPPCHNEAVTSEPIVDGPQEVVLRRSQMDKKSTISDDYVVYLQESDFDIGTCMDPISFSQAIESNDSAKWINSMNDELKSMDQNEVWVLIELPEGYKKVGCNWVFKTKRDSKGNIK
jgi:hypothetical protein